MGYDDVYELEVKGVKLLDWITALVNDEVPDEVRCVDYTGG